jgi:hypothetical protein
MRINNCDKYGTSKSYMSKHEPCKVLSTEMVRQGEKLCMDAHCDYNNYTNKTPTVKKEDAK